MKKINIIGISAILLIIAITVTTILTVIIITNKSESKAEIIEPQAQLVSMEIVSVFPYVSRSTNRYGGAVDEDILYYFTYKDFNGKLNIWEDYDPNSIYYNLCLGDKDIIVFNPNNIYDGNTTLYLTESTLKECIKNKLN